MCEAEVFGYGETERRRANAEQERKRPDSTPVWELVEQETIKELGYGRPDISEWVCGSLVITPIIYYLLNRETGVGMTIVTTVVWFLRRRKQDGWDAVRRRNSEYINRVRGDRAYNDAPKE